MTQQHHAEHLPQYYQFLDALEPLSLPISPSELHGMMCGYLCAGATAQGEGYLRALLGNRKDEESRLVARSMFEVYTISQHQLAEQDFGFELMLPPDEAPLFDRAVAFSEWCEGFVQGLDISDVAVDEIVDEEAQEAFQHIIEFADLDVDSLDVDEEDENALMEVIEFTRVAVVGLHGELMKDATRQGGAKKTTH